MACNEWVGHLSVRRPNLSFTWDVDTKYSVPSNMFLGHHLRILLLLAITTTAVRAFTWADGGYSQHRQKYYNEAEYEDTEDYYYDYGQ